jgi:hypothetical protein
VSLTDRQVDALMGAYLERKKFEAKVMLSVLSESLSTKTEQASLGTIAMMGFGIEEINGL